MKNLFNENVYYDDIEVIGITPKLTFPLFDVLDLRTRHEESRILKNMVYANKASTTREGVMFKGDRIKSKGGGVSIMSPLIAKFIYEYYCPAKGKILDPFEGSHIRPAVAKIYGYDYDGIEIRQDQLDHNKQVLFGIKGNTTIQHYLGDSFNILDNLEDNSYDLSFSSPPYYNTEVYSDIDGDGSNIKDYNQFIEWLMNIYKKVVDKVKKGGFIVINITESRDKKGRLMNVIGHIVDRMITYGVDYYQHIVVLNPLGSASLRANGCFKTNKLVKVHDDILVFKKTESI